MFVFPAVILGFALSIPCIWGIYGAIFTTDLGFRPSSFPD